MPYSAPLQPLALAPVGHHQTISASVCCFSGSLEQQHTVQPSSVFSDGQASTVWQVLSVLQDRGNLFFSQPPVKPLFWMRNSTLSIAWKKSEVKGVLPTLPTELQGMSIVSECMPVQTFAFVLSSPQPGTLSYQHLDSGKTETSPLGRPWKVCTSYICFSLLLPSPERNWELEVFFQLCLAESGESFGQ